MEFLKEYWPSLLFFTAIGILLLAMLIAKFKGKAAYRDRDDSIDPSWMERSSALYLTPEHEGKYFFHYDKKFFAQGHLMEDNNHQVVYEADIWYNNFVTDEVDFINHVSGVTSHHKLGHKTETKVGVSSGNHYMGVGYSNFKFDGESITNYLNAHGITVTMELHGLAYTATVRQNGEIVGLIHSSNNGKNFFDVEGPIEPKIGGKGICVVECKDKDLDVVFLAAVYLARI